MRKRVALTLKKTCRRWSPAHLSADVDGDADDHGGDGDAGDEGDAHGCPDQCAELPQDLLLSAPGLLAPKGAARWTEWAAEKEQNVVSCQEATF